MSNIYIVTTINMKKANPIGRPRKFDREEALHKAMLVFWSRGYENATLLDLQQAMGGITAPSFYSAFGSKEELFREAVSLYSLQEGSGVMRSLTEGKTAKESIDALLRETVSLVSGCDTPRGCLVALGGINCSPDKSEVTTFVQELRHQRLDLIRSRLARGVIEGDLPAETDIDGLANYFTTVVDGICLQAKDGVSPESLKRTVKLAMAALDVAPAGESAG